MKILICDDEPAYADLVADITRRELSAHGVNADCTICARGEEALTLPDPGQFELALLDVDLETMSGIHLGRQLRAANPDIILVYISAYLEFSLDGYTVNAFRYLLKRDIKTSLPGCLQEMMATHRPDYHVLVLREGDKVFRFPYRSIYYFESIGNHRVRLLGVDAEQPLFEHRIALKDLPEELFKSGFLRISQSYVINLAHVEEMNNYVITMGNGVRLNAGRNLYPATRAAWLEWKGQYGNG